MDTSVPAKRFREPIAMVVAVTGPGAITPDKDINTTCAKKINTAIKL
jgi:hypothetical protein